MRNSIFLIYVCVCVCVCFLRTNHRFLFWSYCSEIHRKDILMKLDLCAHVYKGVVSLWCWVSSFLWIWILIHTQTLTHAYCGLMMLGGKSQAIEVLCLYVDAHLPWNRELREWTLAYQGRWFERDLNVYNCEWFVETTLLVSIGHLGLSEQGGLLY